jgi:hypothetical protein
VVENPVARRRLSMVLVPALVGPSLWAGFWVLGRALYGSRGAAVHPVRPTIWIALFALGVLIGWGMLVGNGREPGRSALLDGVLAAALGVGTGLLPACEIALAIPNFVFGLP